MRYTVPAVRAVQNGQELFQFFLPAKTLKELPITVERFDPSLPYDDADQGYQRAAERNRARRFARYLEAADAISPTALMLNDRDSQTKFDAKKGELTFDTVKGPIFNYDGQHREMGYGFRFDEESSFGEFPIPVVMTRGMDKVTEMLQFRVINSTAKGVQTALVNAILAKYQATEGDNVIPGSAQRSVVCYKVTEAINNDPGNPWYDLISLPNQQHATKKEIASNPASEHTRVLRANSFVDALRPVYDYMAMLKITATIDDRAEEIASVVTEFWSALKQQMPTAFDEPNNYALFKSGGVGPMHLVLRDLLIKMHTGHRKFVKDEFLVMIGASELLNDADFWLSTNDDGARIYSGKANWGDLAKRIIRDIEDSVTV